MNSYSKQEKIEQLITQLKKLINGFDFDHRSSMVVKYLNFDYKISLSNTAYGIKDLTVSVFNQKGIIFTCIFDFSSRLDEERVYYEIIHSDKLWRLI